MVGPEALVGPGFQIVRSVAPKGWGWIKSRFWGKTLLVVGPARAGKTTFLDYLLYDYFGPQKLTEPTRNRTPGPRILVRLGRSGSLELNVKNSVDLPGEFGPLNHANAAHDENPHALAVFLDLTRPEDDIQWLEEFSRYLEGKWLGRRGRGNRLTVIVVALNKWDLVEDEQIFNQAVERINQVVQRQLRHVSANMRRDVLVRRCVLVDNPRGPLWVNDIIHELAKALGE